MYLTFNVFCVIMLIKEFIYKQYIEHSQIFNALVKFFRLSNLARLDLILISLRDISCISGCILRPLLQAPHL